MKKNYFALQGHASSLITIPILLVVGVGAAVVCLFLWAIDFAVRAFLFEALLVCAISALVYGYIMRQVIKLCNRQK
jgi:xanthine/uracil permease